MSTLLIIRHAKAEPQAANDRDRTLTERGRRDAVALGRHLAEVGWLPDHAVVSSAVRTRQTFEHLAAAEGLDLAPDIRDELYGASPDEVLGVLRGVPADARCVAYVGHNPTAHLLARGLAGAAGGIGSSYPTATVTALEVDGPWSALGTPRLLGVHTARG